MIATIIPGEQHFVPDVEFPELTFRFNVDSNTKKLSLQSSTDSGATWKNMSTEPPSTAGVGWVQAIDEKGEARWMPINNVIKSSTSSLSALQVWTDFSFPAEIQHNYTFGIFEVPKGLAFEAYGVQVSLFQPAGLDVAISVSFIDDQTGIVLANPCVLTGGNSYASLTFEQSFKIKETKKIKARTIISGNQSNFCGSFLVARLLLKGI